MTVLVKKKEWGTQGKKIHSLFYKKLRERVKLNVSYIFGHLKLKFLKFFFLTRNVLKTYTLLALLSLLDFVTCQIRLI